MNIKTDIIIHLKWVLKWYPPALLLNVVKVNAIIKTETNVLKNNANRINNIAVDNSEIILYIA